MNDLYHHGIKGMRWGVRRYQNEDGSLTEDGLARYNRLKVATATLGASSAVLGALALKRMHVYNADRLIRAGKKVRFLENNSYVVKRAKENLKIAAPKKAADVLTKNLDYADKNKLRLLIRDSLRTDKALSTKRMRDLGRTRAIRKLIDGKIDENTIAVYQSLARRSKLGDSRIPSQYKEIVKKIETTLKDAGYDGVKDISVYGRSNTTAGSRALDVFATDKMTNPIFTMKVEGFPEKLVRASRVGQRYVAKYGKMAAVLSAAGASGVLVLDDKKQEN